ncbi:MAG: FHA domain-containing protein, partial [Planctomycetota bacterium]
MFTLQILDRGQTFLHPVDGETLLLGSAPTNQVVLREESVAAAHARIEPTAQGARLVALAPVRVNGVPATNVELQLGDRIELGRSVIVVGRTVARATRPDEVLADSLPRERTRRPERRHNRMLPIGAALLLGGGIVWLATRDSTSEVNNEIVLLQRWRLGGRVEQAAARIEQLRASWADSRDGRLQRLDGEANELAAVTAEVARLTAALLSPDDPRGYAEWSQELRRLEHDGNAAERVAARQLRSTLAETLLQRPVRPRASEPAAGNG